MPNKHSHDDIGTVLPQKSHELHVATFETRRQHCWKGTEAPRKCAQGPKGIHQSIETSRETHGLDAARRPRWMTAAIKDGAKRDDFFAG